MSSKVKTHEGLQARGDLRITARDARTGAAVRRMQIRNQITEDGLRAMVNMFRQTAATDPSDYKFTTLRVGTGNTLPRPTDTELDVEVAAFDLTDDSTSASQTDGPFEIRVVATLSKDQANGSNLCEAAIGMSNGKIFSRQIHPVYPKSESLVIDYDWRITITA